jgi:hypothetical protein
LKYLNSKIMNDFGGNNNNNNPFAGVRGGGGGSAFEGNAGFPPEDDD